ncbi:MAG: sigma-54-dependent Fis family transcriptional regulator [Planctomycetes bacterium]|nr:sigma-54-dependent Fis family transcriptional regulator [Planctomycetota bacterium]
MARLLIVEDEPNARAALGEVFSPRHSVRLAEDFEAGLEALRNEHFDLVLTDVVLPGGKDGMDLLPEVRRLHPRTPVVVMTAYGTIEKAKRALRDGAYDFLEKPLDLPRLRLIVESALRAREEGGANEGLREALARDGVWRKGFVGESPAIQEVFRTVAKVAPTNATVLLLGESGTGKELVAEAIHAVSARSRGPFVKVNCAALSESLLESELFGHVKGAFTGAVADRPGRFEAADRGTLFLDEVGDIPLHTQVKLLRVLQHREIERVGDNRPVRVDVRLVAATNADLDALVKKGAFREDLYFRLKVVTVRLPPLRERRSDVRLLAEHFRRTYSERHGRTTTGFSPEALRVLGAYEFPGNVRELENVVEAAVVLTESPVIGVEALPAEVGGSQRVEDLPEGDVIRIPAGTSLPEAERVLILDTLARTGGNKSATARILKIGLRTLYRKLSEYGADPGEPPPGDDAAGA